eukprot:TRINITY_DN12299_c0_g1_i1.p1 TRINITY_DN12299_c0_g1~~TRINITY_DN12299_c0_g1_i1.p1  ORF type:complete len:147 (+),score=12.93 TRINITY_DN12299_c0_g1_i1:37-441(+)
MPLLLRLAQPACVAQLEASPLQSWPSIAVSRWHSPPVGTRTFLAARSGAGSSSVNCEAVLPHAPKAKASSCPRIIPQLCLQNASLIKCLLSNAEISPCQREHEKSEPRSVGASSKRSRHAFAAAACPACLRGSA